VDNFEHCEREHAVFEFGFGFVGADAGGQRECFVESCVAAFLFVVVFFLFFFFLLFFCFDLDAILLDVHSDVFFVNAREFNFCDDFVFLVDHVGEWFSDVVAFGWFCIVRGLVE